MDPKQEALKLAYLMLQVIANGGSYSTLHYHDNLLVIRKALGNESEARTIESMASRARKAS